MMTLNEEFEAMRGALIRNTTAVIRDPSPFYKVSFVHRLINELERRAVECEATGDRLTMSETYALTVLRGAAGLEGVQGVR